MNFIITYNISDSEKREIFEQNIESTLPNSTKETSNQTTLVGDSTKTNLNIEKIISDITTSLKLSPNDTVTLYYPILKDGIPLIEKKQITTSKMTENETKENLRMKFLIDYTRTVN